ncbi:MAG: Wzz/FepE/Etk N-terminal domain-containing protein, partial [Gaiellaceae bacterium]
MDFNELVNALWRRKFWIAAVSLGVVAAAYGALHVVKPKYEATTTVALATKNSDPNNFFFYTTMDSIVPVYADAVTARTTLNEAARRLGTSLADIRVQVFKSSPILRIKARSTKPTLAATSANAVASVLLDRVRRGEIGIPALRLTEVDRASIPEKPVFPDRPLTFIVAGLLGLALGVGAALMRENLATTIESGDDLARVAGIPSFGEIPQESAIARMGSVESLVDDPGLRVVSEAFRDVRTNLLFSERDLRSLVVTSPDGSHGKTTVAFGLAVTLARAGTRTVLVDADLRRGR